MPEAIERSARAIAARRGYGQARTNAYVYGTLRDSGWTPKKRGTKMATRRRGILSFFWGRRANKYRTTRGPASQSGSEPWRPFHRRKATHATAVRRRGEEARHERMIYERKAVRGGWGLGRRKVRKTPMTLEEKRAAARRRYHEKHPGAKSRHGVYGRSRASSRGFL